MGYFFRFFSLVFLTSLLSFSTKASTYSDYHYQGYINYFYEASEQAMFLPPPPMPDFSVSDTIICQGDEVQFTDLSTNSPTSWNWVLSGSSNITSTDQNPIVSYNTPGSFPVILVATNADGSDTIIKNNFIVVNPLPTATFNTNQAGSCEDSVFMFFTDLDSTYSVEFVDDAGTVLGTNDSLTLFQNTEVTYTITDTNGCIIDSTFFVFVNDIEVTDTNLTHVECSEDATGAITIAVSGGLGELDILWNTGDTTLTIDNLLAGTYSVTLTDTNGCSISEDYTLTNNNISPDFDFTIEGSNVCADSAVLTLSGVDTLHTISFTNEAGVEISTDTFAIINASGEYEFTITDTASGCFVDSTFTILINDINLNSTVTPNNCYNTTTGGISIIATGGQGDLEITWSDTNLTGFVVSDLDTGTYIATVTDTIGCERIDTFVISTQFPTENIDFNILDNNSCADSVALVFNNLDTNFSIEVLNSDSAVIGTDTITFVFETGDYSFEVTDTNGCTYDSTFSVLLNDIKILDSIKDVTCFDGEDGEIIIEIEGGQPPFTFTWGDPALMGDTISDLDSGWYHLTVTDSVGCQRSDSFFVSTISPLPFAELNIQQSTLCDDSVLVFFTDVDMDDNISIFNSDDSLVGGSLFTFIHESGDYYYVVTNPLGCKFDSNFSIELNDIHIEATVTPNNCENTNNGVIDLELSGDAQPFTIDWVPATLSGDSVFNLGEGWYFVTVTDTNGCSRMDSFEIVTSNGIPDIEFIINQDSLCVDSVEVKVLLSDTSQEVEITKGGVLISTDTVSFLDESGDYQLTVTDTNGCMSDTTFSILLNDISFTANITNPTCNGIDNGVITLNMSGGQGALTLEWADTSLTGNPIGNLEAGWYAFTITDTNNCSLTDSVELINLNNVDGNLTVIDGTCASADDASVFVVMTQGNPPYSYDWSFTVLNNDSIMGTVPGGDHTLTVTDDNGCEKLFEFSVDSGAVIVINYHKEDVYCAGDSDGSIEVFPSGGTPPYTYLWNDAWGVSKKLTNIPAGSYTVEVTDSNGCKGFETIDVIEESVMEVTPDITPETCPYTNDASITVSVSGGVGPYHIEWLDTTVVNDGLFNIDAGDYIVKITGDDGCVHLDTFTIPVDKPILAQFLVNHDTVYLEEGAEIDLANHSIAALSYSWSFGDGAYSTDVHPSHAYSDVGLYYVTLSAFNGVCTSQYTLPVVVEEENPLFVNELVDIQYEIYPNPNNGSFVVDIQSDVLGDVSLEWLDVLGRSIKTTSLQKGKNHIDEQVLPGVYFIRIIGENGVQKEHKIMVE
jgi:PKD repeat protein